jgi:tungstate transport system substrate-binding protein
LISHILLAAGLPPVANNNHVIRLATTTSTENSGLLRYLLPRFEENSGYRVHVIAIGTGKALRMGRDGDVDLVLVHSRSAEERFVRQGFGEKRYGVMHNDFVLVGPNDHPANICDAPNAAEALSRIAAGQIPFVSRGDDSGTHKKERALWRKADITPTGNWYLEAGQGMGRVLQIAGELSAYTLTDRGTWLAFRDKSPLQVCFAGDENLYNPYGIIAVNPQRHLETNYEGAMALIRWITSADGQRLIGNYRSAGRRLFKPAADSDQLSALRQSHSGHPE